jgi:hypothetical protein
MSLRLTFHNQITPISSELPYKDGRDPPREPHFLKEYKILKILRSV